MSALAPPVVRAIAANAACLTVGAVGIFGPGFGSHQENSAGRARLAGLVLMVSAPFFGSISARLRPRWLFVLACAIELAAVIVVLAWAVERRG